MSIGKRKQTKTMKNFTCTILAVSTILTASTSAVLAETHEVGKDTGNAQSNIQTSVVDGNENSTSQTNRHSNKISRDHGSMGHDVSIQENDQYCETRGALNKCTQDSLQENSVRRSKRSKRNQ